MNTLYLDDQQALSAWAAAGSAPVVAIDTEFERQKTYYATLCLVQIERSGEIALIDTIGAFEPGTLTGLLNAASEGLVIHAARQDLEVLSQAGVEIPPRIIDTQIAAALLGFDEQIGYAALVAELLGIELDKSQTRTDWRKRPLSTAQRNYAADDVRHLRELATRLLDQLASENRLAWLEEDCRSLRLEAIRAPDPMQAWQRVKGLGALDPASAARAAALAAWREHTARERNLPRGWLLKDADLVAVAAAAPQSARDLSNVPGLGAGLVRRHAETLLAALDTAVEDDGQRYLREVPNADLRRQAKACASRARERAAELGISPAILVTRREIDALVEGRLSERLSAGWRALLLADIIGEFAPDQPAQT